MAEEAASNPAIKEALRRICAGRQQRSASVGRREAGTPVRPLPELQSGTPQNPIEHGLIAGPTGVGKTELAFKLVFGDDIARGDAPGVILLDAHGSFAEKAAMRCEQLGLFGRDLVRFDRLHDTRRGLGYGFIEPSTNPDPEKREAENREKITDVKSIFVRTEEKVDTTQSVMIDEVMDDVLSLAFDRNEAIPFYFLQHAFQFDSQTYKYLISTCRNDWTKTKFGEYERLPVRDFEYKCGPVRRRIEKFCKCIQARKRSIATFDMAAFLNRGGKLLISGESEGDFGRDDLSRVLGMLIVRIISFARAGKLKRKVIFIIDEGVAAKLIDMNVARALDECRKWNVEFLLIMQHPRSLPPEVGNSVFTNCKRVYVFQQPDPDSALFFAKKIQIPQLSLEVKYTDVSTRRVTTGYAPIETQSTSTAKDAAGGKRVTETAGQHLLPIQQDVQDEHPRYFTFDELVMRRQQELMRLGTGEYECVSTKYISKGPEHFEMLRLKWEGLMYPSKPPIPMAKRKLELALATEYAKPDYQLRLVDYPTWTPPPKAATTTPMRSAATKSSNGQSRQPQNNSRNSGNGTKRRSGNGSASSNGKGGSKKSGG